MGTNGLGTSDNARTVEILDRRIAAHRSVLQLSDGGQIDVRRFFPAGKGDRLRISDTGIDVYLRHDGCWLPLEPAWRWAATLTLGVEKINLTFKEIETPEEMAQFESLRRFHYRGGGGAGRTVPILASGDLWDLPSVLGFIEVSSSMIANTARKKFFSTPYREPNGLHWQEWDTATSKRYSSAISRISRFVIHPEIRGLGIAKHFMEAAREYSRDRWHYGGMRPRFLEITADMLKYYKFVDQAFAFMGETEGNEHRVAKDMTYLVKKAKNLEDGMPQGGGGIMTLQRGYASQLMRYLEKNERPLPEVVASLRNDPSMLDQDAWESLHRLNRRPKPSYVCGLSESAAEYVDRRRRVMSPKAIFDKTMTPKSYALNDVSIAASAKISQSSEARHLQDAFGFVGADVSSELVRDLSFQLTSGKLTLICGASGSGKSLLLRACADLLKGNERNVRADGSVIDIQGSAHTSAVVAELPALSPDKTPLELKGRVPLDQFLNVTAKCGLAEPQLFVRPLSSLSSGQQYRLQVALAFLERPDVVVIDNFCEPLDRFTALAVIRGIKQLASELGVAVLAATASYDRLSKLPGIDQAVLLRRGDRPIVTEHIGPDDLQEGFLLEPLPSEGAK